MKRSERLRRSGLRAGAGAVSNARRIGEPADGKSPPPGGIRPRCPTGVGCWGWRTKRRWLLADPGSRLGRGAHELLCPPLGARLDPRPGREGSPPCSTPWGRWPRANRPRPSQSRSRSRRGDGPALRQPHDPLAPGSRSRSPDSSPGSPIAPTALPAQLRTRAAGGGPLRAARGEHRDQGGPRTAAPAAQDTTGRTASPGRSGEPRRFGATRKAGTRLR